MSNQLELFNDTRVTYTDVELWLLTVPRLSEANRKNHVQDYIRNYDVINKIKRAKALEIFNHTVGIDKQNLSRPALLDFVADFFKPKYKTGCNITTQGELKRIELRLIKNKRVNLNTPDRVKIAA